MNKAQKIVFLHPLKEFTMQKRHIILLLLSFSLSLLAQNNTRESYIQDYYKIAMREMQNYGIPASITMAQGILESNNGNGYLASQANNHFGIKCHDWTGPFVRKDDDEKNECFRKYFEAEDSFKDHSLFLTTRSRYAFLFDLKPDDYKAWAKGLKKAGYATDPHYPAKLIKIIEENELYLLDEFVLSGNSEDMKLPVPLLEDATHTVEYDSSEKDRIKAKRIADRVQLSANGLRYIVVQDLVTFQEIAYDYRLHLWEVYKFNDLARSVQRPELGQRIYLQNKRPNIKKGKLTHTVVVGETMYEISQQYGVRLKSLYKMNDMDKGTQVHAGQVIKLHRKAYVK